MTNSRSRIAARQLSFIRSSRGSASRAEGTSHPRTGIGSRSDEEQKSATGGRPESSKSRSGGEARRQLRKDRPPQAARFISASRNRKLGPVIYELTGSRRRAYAVPPYVCCTYTAIAATCPETCRFKRSGCYADANFTRFRMSKLDAAAVGLSAEDVVLQEVRQIERSFRGGPVPQDGARGGRDLRLHDGGDVGNTAGARMLADPARLWRHKRRGGSVWTYTHCWRSIRRSDWGESISVIASVEKPGEIEQARKRGYAAAIVVEDFPNGAQAFRLPGSKTRIVPCRAQTREGVTCITCRLCLDSDLLKLGITVGLRTHGPGAAAAKRALRACNRATAASSGQRSHPRTGDATGIPSGDGVVGGEGTSSPSPRAAGRGV
jgi:hypothetical protein